MTDVVPSGDGTGREQYGYRTGESDGLPASARSEAVGIDQGLKAYMLEGLQPWVSASASPAWRPMRSPAALKAAHLRRFPPDAGALGVCADWSRRGVFFLSFVNRMSASTAFIAFYCLRGHQRHLAYPRCCWIYTGVSVAKTFFISGSMFRP